jgi:transposase
MGRSRGGLTTKIHALVDAKGLPFRFELTPGQRHDSQAAEGLLDGLWPDSFVLADKAYDAEWIRQQIEAQDATAIIPDRSNARKTHAFSPTLYRERNRVERFFNRLKHCRRVATRYEKLAANYLAMVKLAAIRIWLRSYESTT